MDTKGIDVPWQRRHKLGNRSEMSGTVGIGFFGVVKNV